MAEKNVLAPASNTQLQKWGWTARVWILLFWFRGQVSWHLKKQCDGGIANINIDTKHISLLLTTEEKRSNFLRFRILNSVADALWFAKHHSRRNCRLLSVERQKTDLVFLCLAFQSIEHSKAELIEWQAKLLIYNSFIPIKEEQGIYKKIYLKIWWEKLPSLILAS